MSGALFAVCESEQSPHAGQCSVRKWDAAVEVSVADACRRERRPAFSPGDLVPECRPGLQPPPTQVAVWAISAPAVTTIHTGESETCDDRTRRVRNVRRFRRDCRAPRMALRAHLCLEASPCGAGQRDAATGGQGRGSPRFRGATDGFALSRVTALRSKTLVELVRDDSCRQNSRTNRAPAASSQ